MTYQELVNKIQTIVNEHYMLVDFGYGDLSDLKTRFENTSGNEQVQADYPYCFLNPTSHSRNQSAVTYNFNMIVMDMARGEVSDDPFNNMLAIQSQCQQYIDDIIAHLWNDADPKMNVIYSNLTYTPFNERFSDDVAGMTASLQIQVSVPINDCIAPFRLPQIVADFSANILTPEEGEFVTFTDLSTNNPTEWSWLFPGGTPDTSTLQNPIIEYETSGTYTVSLTASNIGSGDSITKIDYITVTPDLPDLVLETSTGDLYPISPDTSTDPLRWPNIILDTFSGMRPDFPFNYYTVAEFGTWSFVITGIVKRTSDIGQWPDALNMFSYTGIDMEPTTTNWPVNPIVDEEYSFECRWDNLNILTINNFEWRCSDNPGIEDTGFILPGAILKAYYIA